MVDVGGARLLRLRVEGSDDCLERLERSNVGFSWAAWLASLPPLPPLEDRATGFGTSSSSSSKRRVRLDANSLAANGLAANGRAAGRRKPKYELGVAPADLQVETDTEYPELDVSSCPSLVVVRDSGHPLLDGNYKRLPRASRGRPSYVMFGPKRRVYLYWNRKWRIGWEFGSSKDLAHVDDSGASHPCDPYPHSWRVFDRETKQRAKVRAMRCFDIASLGSTGAAAAAAGAGEAAAETGGADDLAHQRRKRGRRDAEQAGEKSERRKTTGEAGVAAASSGDLQNEKGVRFEAVLRDKLEKLDNAGRCQRLATLWCRIRQKPVQMEKVTGMTPPRMRQLVSELRKEFGARASAADSSVASKKAAATSDAAETAEDAATVSPADAATAPSEELPPASAAPEPSVAEPSGSPVPEEVALPVMPPSSSAATEAAPPAQPLCGSDALPQMPTSGGDDDLAPSGDFDIGAMTPPATATEDIDSGAVDAPSAVESAQGAASANSEADAVASAEAEDSAAGACGVAELIVDADAETPDDVAAASCEPPASMAEASAPAASRLRSATQDAHPKSRVRVHFEEDEALVRNVEVVSYRVPGSVGPDEDALWYFQPGVEVACNTCGAMEPYVLPDAELRGEPGRSKFAQWIHYCVRCRDTADGEPATQE
eukprot:TRINITY_DN591_c0_g2_i2.p1 TRINITY_DN591_c0_g2~~TRINITY_DN591_c0_g2_i2.p1  ORF type:complete len:658 (-),score=162.38 TRINITY_DN591_c0_g2_i2:3-1976(-)